MITAIREVRRARGLTLDDVARACSPPTTAQTIGRLETGTRTVSVAWLNRIATALGVTAADLVRLPTRADLPVAAVLSATGVAAPRRPQVIAPPAILPGMIAVTVTAALGDYRSGDVLWCDQLAPAAFATALGHDILAPQPAGGFAFGRLLELATPDVRLLPPIANAPPITIPAPAWIARTRRLMRDL